MKKNGFTLAEVLITLAIIGVVATLTLPSLISNTGEQQYKTALKKGLNTLSEAGQMNEALEGFNYASLTTTDSTSTNKLYQPDGALTQSLFALLHARTKVTKTTTGWPIRGTAGNVAVYFGDGTSIEFKGDDTVSSTKQVRGADGEPKGFTVLYDVNGDKAPNTFSNCRGISVELGATNGLRGGNCQIKDNRIIRDRFTIQLRGGHVIPRGEVAEWAATN